MICGVNFGRNDRCDEFMIVSDLVEALGSAVFHLSKEVDDIRRAEGIGDEEIASYREYLAEVFVELKRMLEDRGDGRLKTGKERVIPFLGDVLPNLPLFWLRSNSDLSYGHLFEHHPDYLSNDIRNLIETSMKEHDVNCEVFVTKSWAFGFPGSILRLVAEEQ